MSSGSLRLSDVGLVGADVVVSALPDWLSVAPVSGVGDAVLEFSAEPNMTGSVRSHVVEVRSADGSLSVRVTVSQEVGDYLWVDEMGRSELDLSVGSGSGVYDVDVLSSVSWVVEGYQEKPRYSMSCGL